MQQDPFKKTVVVGLSGGVDSSVSAFLLKKAGYRVLALFMKNWEEEDVSGVCQSARDQEDASLVCETLDIPLYTVNFSKEYWDGVFSVFLEDLKKGLTPNPDILCNREIKFKAFYNRAVALGADYVATGHYCQTEIREGVAHLLKGADPAKDQSYFLHAVSSPTLKNVLFPIGGLEKTRVRQIAKEHGLKTAEKRDSTGICFIGKRNFNIFLSQHIGYSPGKIETTEGKVLGEHQGCAYHTMGQRRGLHIGGPGAAWFVVGKDVERNVVIVAQGDDHPALFSNHLTAHSPTWITGSSPTFPFTCRAKIRYRTPEQPCTVTQLDASALHVTFNKPQRAITPGQSVVFYQDNTCLGGALIS